MIRFLITCALLALASVGALAGDEPVDFGRDVRPILSDKCFQCHGPDEGSRAAGLRLDQAASATSDRGGYAAVKSGDAEASELIARILSKDEDLVMPPVETGKTVSAEEVATLRRWIDQGAKWSGHWAFETPTRPRLPELPSDAPADWRDNPIDAFVFAKLHAAGMAPSPRASRETLLRRLYLDLTGLPPTLEQREAFLADAQPDAAARLVARLLASPHYGERWGRHWLDAARYSDSDGYEKDLQRSNWHYRDWVVEAINQDKPYDEFIVEQVAGDLLPGAEQDERIATAFLRNSMVNEEGGADPEQFRVEGLFDRMDAIGKSILGITTQCAQCHTHKYDPLTIEDYYGMLAYLNSDYEAIIVAYTDAERSQIDDLASRVAEIENELRELSPHWEIELRSWADALRSETNAWSVAKLERENWTGQKFAYLEDGSVLSQSYAPPAETNHFFATVPAGQLTAVRLELLTHPELPRGGPGRSVFGTNALTELKLEYLPPKGEAQSLAIASATADVNPPEQLIGPPFFRPHAKDETRTVGPIAFAIDGDNNTAWTTQTGPADRNQPRKAVFVLTEPIKVAPGGRLRFSFVQNHGGWLGNQRHNNLMGRFRVSTTSSEAPVADPLPSAVREIVRKPPGAWSHAEVTAAFSYWRTTRNEWAEQNQQIAQLLRGHPEGVNQYVVQQRETPRETFVMQRGNFLSPGERVEPRTPEFLHPFDDDAPPNRLGFARWLVDERSPTAARTVVNRVWQHYFGIGLIETPEDLGSQAPPASHPRLLDWLAVEFMESDWSLKHLHRLITNSATYQQRSIVRDELHARDAYNRLLWRGPRVRVEAEVIRDQALAAAGLLNRELGGPVVYPRTPEFLLTPPTSYGIKVWPTSKSDQRRRRSLYVQAYRTTPYPVLQVFDAPPGDTACVRRARSNTPLQALTLLNQVQFMDCARGLGRRMLDSDVASDAGRIAHGFRLLLSREPDRQETEILEQLLARARKQFAADASAAVALMGDANPDDANPDGGGIEQQAAWTMVARAMLNLDETITKP